MMHEYTETTMTIDTIRKLLRLARDKGASEAEAASALAMAQKLMMQHNIEHIDDADPDVNKAVRGEWMHINRDDKWEILVGGAVAKLFTCRHVLIKRGGSHQFVGKPENVRVAEVTFVWVCEQVEELYRLGLRTFKSETGRLSKETRGNFRRSFKEACARRIYHRVNEIVAHARNEIPEHMALVVVDQSLAQADELLKGTKEMRTQAFRPGLGSGAGYAAGDNVKLQGNFSPERKLLK
jgi:hypothetical protein